MEPPVDLGVLVSGLPDLLAVASRDGLLYLNPAWTAALGWSESEIRQQIFLDLVHPEDREATDQVLQGVWEGASSDDFSNRLRRKDGSYVTLRWSLFSHHGRLYASARDITQYVALRTNLGESLAISEGILATAVDPIIIIETDGTIAQANEATEALFGYPIGELLGKNVSMLMPEPYRSEHDGYLMAYLGGGVPKVIGIGREVEARRADGTVFPMSLSVSEVIVGDRHVFTGIIHDLTQRNAQRDQLEEAARVLEDRVRERTAALGQAVAEYERSNQDLERFAYIASHDLQAPLRNVRQGLELLDEHLTEQSAGFDEEAEELRGLVMGSVGRMEGLIAGLLEYSRVQSAEERQLVESVSLSTVAESARSMLASDLEAAGTDLAIGALPTVLGRPSLLAQVFQNLIANGIRYRSPERPHLMSIEQVGGDGGAEVEIQVTDNGIGIDPSQHERIFEMFRRASTTEDGVGIGLTLCRRIIEGHGGSIAVSSDGETGSTFTIRLPVAYRPPTRDV